MGRASKLDLELERLQEEQFIQGRCIVAPGHTKIYAVSTRFLEATVTCRIKGENIIGYPGNFVKGHLSNDLKTPIVTVYLKNQKHSSYCDYEIGGHFGVAGGRPDKSHIYRLPFEQKKWYMVSCEPGRGGHTTTSMRYAIDFSMPEGSVVCAARDGVVVACRDNSSFGGPELKFHPVANFLIIKHQDGSYGEYCHLKKNGVLVRLGTTVRAGQPIALSGNTGLSKGPHLHFNVYFYSSDIDIKTSVPVIFATNLGIYRTPRFGDFLRVPDNENLRVRAVQL